MDAPPPSSTSTSTPATTTTGDDDQNHQNQKWFPLESNPTLMNQYMATLGWDIAQYHLVDVFSTEDWALDMIPSPVLAVLLLYPLTHVQLQYEQQEKEQLLRLSKDGPSTNHTNTNTNDDVWFMKQRIGNACGTIGLLHAMMNAVLQHQSSSSSSSTTSSTTVQPPPLMQPNSWLDIFYKSSTTMMMKDPIQRAELLENDPTIATFHDRATSSTDNQTSRGTVDDDIITHFIAFVSGTNSSSTQHQPFLYELDGRKLQPICHGTTATANTTLLYDACTIIKEQFMARDPNELRFTIMALVAATNSEE